MIYDTQGRLSLADETILADKVLPTAKDWVMNYAPGTSLHENGHRILRHWQVKCPELRRHMQGLRDKAGSARPFPKVGEAG